MKDINWSPAGLIWHRFRRRQAYCAWSNNGVWIKSYSTVVGLIDSDGGVYVRPGYEHYSITTSKQRSQIIASYLRGTLKEDCRL